MLPYLSFETINDDTFSNFNTGEPCILGIDEAGRGPVLGHLVYGCAIVLADKKDQLESLGVKDSKMLSPVQREKIFNKMKEAEFITYSLSVVHPRIISAYMQHLDRLSLNEISHNCTINLLQNAIQKGICIQEVFIDLVGSKEEKYQQFLKSHFPSLKITVSKKADSIFPIVGAASIAAKVTRDQLLSNWSFLESGFSKEELGSGYPSDPSTKYFISKNIDPIFGFPSLVRFSWKTIERLLEKKTVKCQWNTNELFDCPKQRTLKEIWSGIKKEGKKDNEKENAKMTRHLFFTERHISNIEHLE